MKLSKILNKLLGRKKSGVKSNFFSKFIGKTRAQSSSSHFKPYIPAIEGYDAAKALKIYRANGNSIHARYNVDTFAHYCQFIYKIRDLADTDIVPLKDLMTAPDKRRRILSIRYDIDFDPNTALRLAKFNARYGICGSFFILHTAYYYGMWENGVFCRNPNLKNWLKHLIVAGCEMGLHIDPLSIYVEKGIDGASALREELRWLRAQGAVISGTVSHNSFPVYNAENFEIFAGKSLGHRSNLQYNNLTMPFGILSESELGLTYEGNFPIPEQNYSSEQIIDWRNSTDPNSAFDEKWMKTYLLENPCFRRSHEVVVWHHGNSEWTYAHRISVNQKKWAWKVPMDEMISLLNKTSYNTRAVIILHPIYFSGDIWKKNGFELNKSNLFYKE